MKNYSKRYETNIFILYLSTRHFVLRLCLIAIMIASVVESLWRLQSITIIPDRNHLLTSTLHTVQLQYYAACCLQALPCQLSPTYSRLQQANVGGKGGGM